VEGDDEMLARKRFIGLTVGTTAVQALLTITSIVISFRSGMMRFDHPEIPAGLLERVCDYAASILVQPVDKILGTFNITPRGPVLEWTVLLFNSLVWGAAVALFVCSLSGGDTSNQQQELPRK
jgi:hypothetical protein